MREGGISIRSVPSEISCSIQNVVHGIVDMAHAPHPLFILELSWEEKSD